ncbi:MAG: TPR end-of-group domain-containing protein [Planctomycetota bacterium]|jgi:tetratricopeptide (TPR) repeat protein
MPREEPGALELAGLRFQIGIFEEALAEDPRDTDALRYLAHAYNLIGRHEDGIGIDKRLVALHPDDPRVRYNLACSFALSDRQAEALETLAQAVELGFEDINLMRKDQDLDGLRSDPRYLLMEADVAKRAGQ